MFFYNVNADLKFISLIDSDEWNWPINEALANILISETKTTNSPRNKGEQVRPQAETGLVFFKAHTDLLETTEMTL